MIFLENFLTADCSALNNSRFAAGFFNSLRPVILKMGQSHFVNSLELLKWLELKIWHNCITPLSVSIFGKNKPIKILALLQNV